MCTGGVSTESPGSGSRTQCLAVRRQNGSELALDPIKQMLECLSVMCRRLRGVAGGAPIYY